MPIPSRVTFLSHAALPARGVALLALVLALCNCGGDVPDDAQPRPADVAATSQRRSPVADSIRARREAALARRPDTLGMRADSSRVLGAASAKVWVIVTSDFQCQSCRDFARNALSPFRRDVVAKGMARVAFVNFPQEQNFNARFAAAAALCAGTVGRFWPMHDSLFAQQPVWERMPDPRPYLESLAGAAGVPTAVQNDCMTRNRMLLRLATDIDQSRRAGIAEVPSVLVANQPLRREELTYDGLVAAVQKALADAR